MSIAPPNHRTLAANVGRIRVPATTGVHTHGMIKLPFFQAGTPRAVSYPDAGEL